MIKFSLITTLYNESEYINEFLNSYKKQTKYADEFIIVDGGSTDGTVEKIQKFMRENPNLNIKLIIEPHCNKKYTKAPVAKGRNIAIKKAKYDYILVTDAGCILDKHWVEEITKPFHAYQNVDVVAGWYEPIVKNEFQRLYTKVALPKLEKLDVNKFLPSSRSLAFKKQCWLKVGGYPEKTLTAEDTLFDILLKKNSCIFYFNKNAVVYWQIPKNENEAVQKQFNYAKGDGELRLFLGKFLIRTLLTIFPIDLIIKFKSLKEFKLAYKLRIHHQMGYFKGLLNG